MCWCTGCVLGGVIMYWMDVRRAWDDTLYIYILTLHISLHKYTDPSAHRLFINAITTLPQTHRWNIHHQYKHTLHKYHYNYIYQGSQRLCIVHMKTLQHTHTRRTVIRILSIHRHTLHTTTYINDHTDYVWNLYTAGPVYLRVFKHRLVKVIKPQHAISIILLSIKKECWRGSKWKAVVVLIENGQSSWWMLFSVVLHGV